MRKVWLILIVAAVFASCSDSDSDSGKLNLSTASVKDATLIYKRGGEARSEDGETSYWKLDRQGNETRVVCYDEEGKESDVEITSISKASENLLLLNTEYGNVLADTRTEKLYQAPADWEWNMPAPYLLEGGDGMLYYLASGWMINQLDPQKFTYRPYLAEGQEAQTFLISRKGSCWYGNEVMEAGKIMTKGGRIYLPKGQVFLSEKDGMFYSVNESKITRWRETSGNEIVEEDVCELETVPTSIIGIFINGSNKNVVLSYLGTKGEFENGIGVEYEVFVEFDGTSAVEKRAEKIIGNSYEDDNIKWERFRNLHWNLSSLDIYDISQRSYYQWREHSAGQVFFDENSGLYYTLDLSTYELTERNYEIPANEYEVYTRERGFNSMLFSALRYLDGKVVIGEVDKNGQVRIISEQESSAKVTQLIPLN